MMNSMNSNGTGGTGTPFSCEYCEKSVGFRGAQCLDRVFFSEKNDDFDIHVWPVAIYLSWVFRGSS